jgi:hypothetical protein
MLNVVNQCRESLFERSGQSSFQILRIQSREVQATEMTGISIFGKMSVGVRRITAGLSKRMRIARTTNVYGRLRANRTIHMDVSLLGYGV